MRLCLLCCAALVAFTGSVAAETAYHVALTGSDLNPGTRRQPFATLERARQAVRIAGPGKVRRVIVHGGSYELQSTCTLGHVLWDFAEGVPSRQFNDTHVYGQPGIFRVALVVWDDRGRGAIRERSVTVKRAPQ